MQAVENRFGTNAVPAKPIEWLIENGSCYTAGVIRSIAKFLGPKPITTPLTNPQSNDMAKSFVKASKRDNSKQANKHDSKAM